MSTRRHPTKVVSTEELNLLIQPLRNVLNACDEISLRCEFFSNDELNALNTITSKTSALIDKITSRMTKSISKVEQTEEEKAKKHALKEKLKTLTPEQIDKLLSTL